MEKNYNYERQKLHLPEYGRHIQQMVEALLIIEDRAERNKQARAVIAVMGNLNPLLRDTADFTHKLWDHLFIISDFRLDVDSPYPRPTREVIEAKPQKMEYSRRRIEFKHYGKYIADMIRSLSTITDQTKRDEAISNIARYMRTKSFEYNQEHPNNEIIIKDIRRLAKGDIALDEEAINNIRSSYKNNYPQHNTKGARNNKNAKNGAQRNGGGQKSYGSNNNNANHANHQNHGSNQNRNFTKGGGQRRNNNNNNHNNNSNR